jgi:hypothetical protein
VALERAHALESDLFELWSATGDYDEVWKVLSPALRTLRAVGEPEQDGLF